MGSCGRVGGGDAPGGSPGARRAVERANDWPGRSGLAGRPAPDSAAGMGEHEDGARLAAINPLSRLVDGGTERVVGDTFEFAARVCGGAEPPILTPEHNLSIRALRDEIERGTGGSHPRGALDAGHGEAAFLQGTACVAYKRDDRGQQVVAAIFPPQPP